MNTLQSNFSLPPAENPKTEYCKKSIFGTASIKGDVHSVM